MSDLSVTRAGHMDKAAATEAKVKQATEQFETFFLKQMLQHVNQSAEEESIFGDSAGMNQFRQLLHDGLAERAAGQLGVADMMIEQLQKRHGIAVPGQEAQAADAQDKAVYEALGKRLAALQAAGIAAMAKEGGGHE